MFSIGLINCLYSDIISKLRTIITECYHISQPVRGPVLLKVMGTCNDNELLLSMISEHMKGAQAENLICNGSRSPYCIVIDSIRMVGKSVIPLIFVTNAVKFKYTMALLDGLINSLVPCVVIVSCNDSHSIHLPALMEQSIITEHFTMKNPVLVLKDVTYRLFCFLPEMTNLFVGGELMLYLYNRFVESIQSFMDMNIMVNMAMADHLCRHERRKVPKVSFQVFIAVYKVFSKFLRTASILSPYDIRTSSGVDLGYYVEMQQEDGYVDKICARIKSQSLMKGKEDWLRLFEYADEVIKEIEPDKVFNELKKSLKTLKGVVEKTEVVSTIELMKQNMNKSPSRRKPIKDQHQFLGVIEEMHKFFDLHLNHLPKDVFVQLPRNLTRKDISDVPKTAIVKELIEYGCL
ncbi:unnamed protein product [Bursaphelenchus okinawaensis]|uniref:Uncharacterized protein n=1 Tax=Bursaphelenchus okinawaensis TaxID=465554 RepID=A0A811K6J9_9BILA|nr:unnamed protein product [Bursaphelenchus okinawaensis]CAG9093269.1 unnamed protein product [Bursaphelenchus okinawaensis]